MNRPDCDERSDSADKLANKQDEPPSSVTTDDGLSEAEDPESDNFDHHAGLSKAKALAMTAILGKNDHAAGDPSEAAGSPVPYPEVKEDDPDSDLEQITTQRTVSTHTPSVLDHINELLAKGREESNIREDQLNKSIEDLNGKLHQLITLVEKQTKILDDERSAAQDRETRLKKKIQNLEDTVSRLSEVQEKTLRESNEGREKIARQLSDLKSNSTLQAKKLEKRHQPRHEEKKELECGSTSESPSCSSSSNPGHVETQPNSRDHSKGRPQGNTHGKEKASSEPNVNMPSTEQSVTNDDSDTNGESVETWTSVLKKRSKPVAANTLGMKKPAGKLVGALRMKKSVFYVGGISLTCTSQDIVGFLKDQCPVLQCRMIPSRRRGTQAAYVVIPESHADDMERTEWPDHVYARRWQFQEAPTVDIRANLHDDSRNDN